ncbi:MAG: hypothetical protein JO257_12205 [Deltaproteobacteria bacterium]|nr:hypothetical protein [Deltaproteobacteria bacterium]
MNRIGLVLAVAACGSSSSKTPDAPMHVVDGHPDAPIDAAPDAYLPDAPEPVSGHYHYVISRQVWPTTNQQARDDGFDLNNDGSADNQLGMVMVSLAGQGFDVQTPTDQAFARGTPILLADLGANDLTTSQTATFTIYQGSDPNPPACSGSADTVCGHHLHGSGTFTAAATPRDTPLTGAIATGQLTAGPGHLSVSLSAFGATPVTLLGARAKLTPTAGGIMTGILGGAVSVADRDSKIYPGFAASMNAVVMRDCTALSSPPQCGCASGSSGASVISLFDTTHDCNITTQEIHDNSLIMALFAPDVTVEGQQALSVGFAVTAVDATFTP